MPVIKNKSTEENRDFWSHVETVAKEVEKWPNWSDRASQVVKDQDEHVEGLNCPSDNNGCS